MNIALTGGTGFIGSHFLHQALAAGHNVLALRRSSSSCPRIPIDQQPQWLECQLDEVLSDHLRGCEVLVHLAAHTGNVPYDSLANCLHWNLSCVLALFEQARLAGIRRFVVAGSCFEYGRSGERFAAIPTDAPLEPTNSYAASKAAASIAFCQWAEEYLLSLDLLRVFHVYGDGEPETRLWPSMRRAALAGEDFLLTMGEQIREFMPVEAVARTFLYRTIYEPSASQVNIFNLSSGNPITIRAFAEAWWKKWEAEGNLVFGAVPYRGGEVMRYVAGGDVIKVKSDINRL
jgi:nucleoside-diphosphate-sugar epimerase